MTNSLLPSTNFVVGCNYWASHAGTRMWSDWQPEVVDADLRQLSEGGLQILRVFPLWPDFQPLALLRTGEGAPREVRMLTPEGEVPLPDTPEGQAGLSTQMLDRFQVFADLAERYQLKLIVGLITGWMSGRLFAPPALEGCNVLTDPAALMWQTRFVRAFVRRFKNHPAVAAWDLGNECNVMAAVPSPEAAWAWASAITNAIRVEDSSRPIVSGMHGTLDYWPPSTLGEVCDLLTTHPYPLWTQYCDQDPVNTIRTVLHATAETRLYADWGGKPCLAEETGTMGPMLASDPVAADFIRTSLFSLWAHDGQGLLWWCAYDQDHLAHAPYDWNTCERELGLIDSQRRPHPTLAVLGLFRRFLETLPIPSLPPHPREAVCLLSEGQDRWAAAYSSFILARQAGFELEYQLGEQPLKDADLYLVPSIRGINVISRRRWLALLERVRAGATLYVSLDDGILHNFEATFGLQIQTRARRADRLVTFTRPGGESFHLPAPFRLKLTLSGAKALASEPDGNPAFSRFSYGRGQVYLLTAPLETALASQPGAFHEPDAQPFWTLYQTVAADVLARRAVHKNHPLLGLTEHPVNEQERIVVAINYSPTALSDSLSLAPGWTFAESWRGPLPDPNLLIPANDAAVWRIVRREEKMDSPLPTSQAIHG